jgi:hypothetical protein
MGIREQEVGSRRKEEVEYGWRCVCAERIIFNSTIINIQFSIII